jgi:UDP-N-acetyl-D-galactosamine dehydrogenase
MIGAGASIKGARVIVLGLTFKENCPDLRNSRVIDVVRELESYGVKVLVHDPVADGDDARREYSVVLSGWNELPRAEAIVAAVAHREFRERPFSDYLDKVIPGGTFIDVKSSFDPHALRAAGLTVWRL